MKSKSSKSHYATDMIKFNSNKVCNHNAKVEKKKLKIKRKKMDRIDITLLLLDNGESIEKGI